MNTADAMKKTIPDGTRPASDSMTALTAEVVRAYVTRNRIAPGDLPNLIGIVSEALGRAGHRPEPEPKQEPAVPVRKSVREDRIFCLECGKSQQALKRHLSSAHGLTPEEYREKWELPRDYPMTAPAYSARRSELATSLGLGRRPKPEAQSEPEPQPEPEPAKKPRKAASKSGEKASASSPRKRPKAKAEG